MNEYHYYEKICSMKKIATQYTLGKSYAKKLEAMAEDISNQNYRVAFIGEFNKGKSSLINALLGTDILPMDILPMTASVIRIRYGTSRKIYVHYKDGRIEEHSLSELEDFATKDTDERARVAATVSEVEVKFPSSLGRNHIEIFDTPGLNDDAATTKHTLSVIGRIDAAVVVISAKFPISDTEQKLIINLIRASNIRRIIFAVTYIDLLESEMGKKQVIDFIRHTKLSGTVLLQAHLDFHDDVNLSQKADAILANPYVFAVSALWARQGIEKDDLCLLGASNVPVFKDELLTILMGAMQETFFAKTRDALQFMLSALPSWREQEKALLVGQLVKEQADYEKYALKHKEKIAMIRGRLTQWFHELDKYLKTRGLSVRHGFDRSLSEPLRKMFIAHLSRVSPADKKSVLSALREAMHESANNMQRIGEMMKECMLNAMDKLAAHLNNVRVESNLDASELDIQLKEYRTQHKFPEFCWTVNPMEHLSGRDVMPVVDKAIDRALKDFGYAMSEYLAEWRLVLFRQLDADAEKITRQDVYFVDNDAKRKLDALPFVYQEHMEALKEMARAF